MWGGWKNWNPTATDLNCAASWVNWMAAESGGHVHMMFVYRDPNNAAGYDDNISLSFKLPVREE